MATETKSGRPGGPKAITEDDGLLGLRFLTSSAVMDLLGYADCNLFWQASRSQGIPYTRISTRRTILPEIELRPWLASRSTGSGLVS
jgi:hypothetical protein